MNKLKFLKNLSAFVFLTLISTSCGIYKYSEASKNPTNADDRIKKNMESGKGFRLGSLGGKGSAEFMFASSNPLWRATVEKLNFAPLSNVDYAGGIIVTDWFNEGSSNEQIKITIRFLTNEIRSDAIDVNIHKKICEQNTMNCTINRIENNLNSEIKLAILKKAAKLEKEDQAKIKKKVGDYKVHDGKKKRKKKKK